MLSRERAGENGPVSARRRVLPLTVSALLAVAAVVLTLGFDGRAQALRHASAPQDRLGPVLLVPGYGGSTEAFVPLSRLLRAHGREVLVVQLPGNGTGDLRDAAQALRSVADAALQGGAPSVDVVGYSAGGITARYWVKELGGAAHARRVVTLGSPHHGTQLAALGPLLGATCPVGCQQLVPGSELLTDLNEGDETPAGPQWLSMWSATDQVVTPPETSRLDGAQNVVLQGICPGRAASHGQLVTMPLVTGIVLRALGTAPLDAPRPADCTELQATGRGGD